MKVKSGIIIGFLFVFALIVSACSMVQPEDKPVIVLGEDLSEEQKDTVLSLMGVTRNELENYTVLTVSNEDEHRYLGAYIDKSLIGDKALSSVMLTPAEEGSGVMVTTQNINYCTTGMYRNALLTAGLKDTHVLVVGPGPISGTAGLIGAVKGYEEMSGNAVSDSTLDIALNELITTGEIASTNGYGDEMEDFMAYVKGKLAAGELESSEDIIATIHEAEGQFGITLSDDQIQQVLGVMDKVNDLGLSPDTLLDQAEDLYQQFGEDFFDQAEEAVKKGVTDSVNDYFDDMEDEVTNFLDGVF